MNEVRTGAEGASEEKVVRVTAAGDLAVRGEARSNVEVAAAPGTATVTDFEQGVEVRLENDGGVVMPAGWSLAEVTVAGDAAIGSLAGTVAIRSVAGDLALSDVGSVRVATVGGDVAVRGVSGDCRIEHAEDVVVAQVNGGLVVERAAGDVRLAAVQGDITVAATGDIRAAIEPAAGRTYRLTAGGTIKLSIPVGASLQLVMRSGGGEPRLRLGGTRELDVTDGTYRLTLGDGSALMELTAGSRITVQHASTTAQAAGSPTADGTPGRASEEIGRHVEERVAEVTAERVDRLTQLGATLPRVLGAAGLSDREAERIARQVEQSLERAVERVRRQTERTITRMERRLARAERRGVVAEPGAERAWGFRWRGFSGSRPEDREPARSSGGATEAERLAILRLVESKRLTAAEAERLLAALED